MQELHKGEQTMSNTLQFKRKYNGIASNDWKTRDIKLLFNIDEKIFEYFIIKVNNTIFTEFNDEFVDKVNALA